MAGQIVKLKQFTDERGILKAVNQIPFEAKRLFFISNVPKGTVRGDHFSKTTSFLYVMIRGGCKVSLDDGTDTQVYDLTIGDALLFPKKTWLKVYQFQEDSILCVLADTEYNAADYVADYDEFRRNLRTEDV